VRLEKIIKWDEELIGKNSVTPWIKDKSIISMFNWVLKLKDVLLMTFKNAYQLCK
jgi:hypothetical protein